MPIARATAISRTYKTVVRAIDYAGLGPFLRPIVSVIRAERAAIATLVHKVKQKRRLANYMVHARSKKLQLGSSSNVLRGWLNTDLNPASTEITYLDATQRFPLPSDAFDFVFCEHFIEHITRDNAKIFLSEVHRCLKPLGVFRVATPALER